MIDYAFRFPVFGQSIKMALKLLSSDRMQQLLSERGGDVVSDQMFGCASRRSLPFARLNVKIGVFNEPEERYRRGAQDGRSNTLKLPRNRVRSRSRCCPTHLRTSTQIFGSGPLKPRSRH
jgi:hypothetical protein